VAKQDEDYRKFSVRFDENQAFLIERARERLGLSATAFIRMAAIKEANAITQKGNKP
jgi:uncharacterized protein (DUF1778 family)